MNNRSPFLLVLPGDQQLDVRSAVVRERMMAPFSASVTAVTPELLDLEAVVGQPVGLTGTTRGPLGAPDTRTWTGVVKSIALARAERGGLHSYQLELAGAAWMLVHKRELRIFQCMSELGMALKVLGEWNLEPRLELERGAFPSRKYRVQYDESDWAFVSRMLEEAGIAMWFEEADGGATRMVLGDRPQTRTPRALPLPFTDDLSSQELFARDLHVVQRVRPGRYTIRDHDYRRAHDEDLAETAELEGKQAGLERYHYLPGAFLFGSDDGEATAVADARGKYRTRRDRAKELSEMRLAAKRASGKVISFETNAFDLQPASVVHVVGHPRSDLGSDRPLLILETVLSGGIAAPLTLRVSAIPADRAYRPPLITPRPKIRGVQTAVITAPPGKEIDVDEFGRVHLQFHWDRQGKGDDTSSCYAHASQPWGGSGFGGVNLPRVGQDVIVDFFGGDPDRPVVTGRTFSAENPVPYKLPENKTQSGWRSQSTGGGGGHNEVMFDDKAGSELLRVHAQRDMHVMVKNDSSASTGNDRSITVGGDDLKVIGGGLDTKIRDGDLMVSTDESFNQFATRSAAWKTDGNFEWTGLEGFVATGASFDFVAEEKMTIDGSDSVTFHLGPSVVRLTPAKIEIWGPIVHLTPEDESGGG